MVETKTRVQSILHFSPRERLDLLISWLTLSIAFSIILLNVDFVGSILGVGKALSWETALPIGFIAVGTGFVFHELAHREAAKHYGFHSEFRAWYPMLGIALIFAVFTGWILAAPGATYFFGQNVSRKQNGIISFAGPLINIIFGFIILFLGLAFHGTIIETILLSVAMINFWFAFFNLLPILMLDGSKVLAWNPGVWVVGIAIAGIMSFVPNLVLTLIGILV